MLHSAHIRIEDNSYTNKRKMWMRIFELNQSNESPAHLTRSESTAKYVLH